MARLSSLFLPLLLLLANPALSRHPPASSRAKVQSLRRSLYHDSEETESEASTLNSTGTAAGESAASSQSTTGSASDGLPSQASNAAVVDSFSVAVDTSTIGPDDVSKDVIVPVQNKEAGDGGRRGEGFWSVKGTDYVDSNGLPVRFSGVIWSGLETPNKCLGGLRTRTVDSHLDQMKDLGFNVITLIFAGETLGPWVYPAWGATGSNQDLWPLTSMQQLDLVIGKAGERGMKVILVYHRMRLTWDNELGTWWDPNIPESVWLSNWGTVAERYRGNPTIIGVNLFNEVHKNDKNDTFPGFFPEGAPYWEENSPNEAYNFRRACIAGIDVIHKIEPNWIIFLQGMWQGPYWWGGNLAKVWESPITEPAGKIALVAHDYGPKVAPLPWFYDEDFPKNLPALYSKNWGFVAEKGIGPLCVGEFGSFLPQPTNDFNQRERSTFLALVDYMKKVNASWTIAFWGPDSKDTGGILLDDWQTVNEEKMAVLQPIMHRNFEP